MKKKDLKELHHQNRQELQKLAQKIKEELVKLRMDKHAGRLKNVHLVETKRHDLAIVKTILKEKELGL
jgi:large subunit ribosomal protein L29